MSACASHNLIDLIVAQLRALDDAESRTLDDGSLLLSKLPPRPDGRFSLAYAHEIYAGLTDDQIDRLAASVQLKLPADLRQFFALANGLSLFHGSLSIRGLRNDHSRGTSVRLPVSLEYGNVLDKPQGVPERDVAQIRFGFYKAGAGAELAMDLGGDVSVYAYPRYERGPTLYRWPDLQTFLLSEVGRMSSVFKERGGDVHPLNAIAPSWIDGA